MATSAGLPRKAPQTAAVQDENLLARGMFAGAVGGLLGAWTMIRFAELWSKLGNGDRTRLGTREEWDAVSNVVDIVTRRVIKLSPRQKQRAATGFHYVLGTLLGAAYGALAEVEPAVASGAGAPFGALEWLLGNKLTAPRFGLVRPRGEYSRQERLQTFAAHVVFGITAELVRRGVRSEL